MRQCDQRLTFCESDRHYHRGILSRSGTLQTCTFELSSWHIVSAWHDAAFHAVICMPSIPRWLCKNLFAFDLFVHLLHDRIAMYARSLRTSCSVAPAAHHSVSDPWDLAALTMRTRVPLEVMPHIATRSATGEEIKMTIKRNCGV